MVCAALEFPLQVDSNGDGLIDFAEFKDAVMNQKIVLSCMGV